MSKSDKRKLEADKRRDVPRGTVSGTAKALRHREQTHVHVRGVESGVERWVRDDGTTYADNGDGSLRRVPDYRAAALDAAADGERLVVAGREADYVASYVELEHAARVAAKRRAANAAKREAKRLRVAREAVRPAWRNPDTPAGDVAVPVSSPVRAAFVAVERSDSPRGVGVPALQRAVRRDASRERRLHREAMALADAQEAARLARIRAARREALAKARAAKALGEAAMREAQELAAKRRAAAAKRRESRRRVRVS